MKSLLMLIHGIVFAIINIQSVYACEDKHKVYKSLISSYRVMNMRGLKTDIGEVGDIILSLNLLKNNTKRRKMELIYARRICDYLSKGLDSDELYSMNGFEKTIIIITKFI